MAIPVVFLANPLGESYRLHPFVCLLYVFLCAIINLAVIVLFLTPYRRQHSTNTLVNTVTTTPLAF